MSHNWEVTLPGATDKYVMKIPANIAQAQHGALYFYRQPAGQHATLLYVFRRLAIPPLTAPPTASGK